MWSPSLLRLTLDRFPTTATFNSGLPWAVRLQKLGTPPEDGGHRRSEPRHAVGKRRSNLFQTLRASGRMEAPLGKPKRFPPVWPTGLAARSQDEVHQGGEHVGMVESGAQPVVGRGGGTWSCWPTSQPPAPHKVTQSEGGRKRQDGDTHGKRT